METLEIGDNCFLFTHVFVLKGNHECNVITDLPHLTRIQIGASFIGHPCYDSYLDINSRVAMSSLSDLPLLKDFTTDSSSFENYDSFSIEEVPQLTDLPEQLQYICLFKKHGNNYRA